MSAPLPVLFFDRPFPADYHDMIDGRAVAVGPDDDALAGADAVIAGMRRWDAAAIALAPRLKVISRTGVGYDTVDVAAAQRAGVAVCYAPEAPTVSTAEHTMMLLLALTKRLPELSERARAGGVGPAPDALELDGRTLGLVGFGRIAQRVARAAGGLGMIVIAHDPYLAPGLHAPTETTLVPLDEVWERSDIVSLHAPATPATHHLIDDAVLGRMRPGAFLVNCARGALVDQEALLRALVSGRLAGAALDVTEPEPLPAGHPLLEHPRVIVTPHVASGTAAGRRRLYQHAIDHALRTLAGDPCSLVPEHAVLRADPAGA